MLPMIVFMVMLMGGTALSPTSDESPEIPNYIQVLLAGYKVPIANSLDEGEMDASDDGEIDTMDDGEIDALHDGEIDALDDGDMNLMDDDDSADPALNALANLERDISRAYNLSYKIRDPTGRILYREEHGDGEGTMYGFINVTENDSSAAVHYALRIEEKSSSSSEPTDHHMPEHDIRNFVVGDDSSEVGDDSSEVGDDNSVVRDDNSVVGDDNSDFDDSSSEEISSELDDDDEHQMALVMFRMKPTPRGYEQVWKKGEGLVVNKEYSLPSSYNYRTGNRNLQESESEEDEQPLYIFSTKPEIKVFGATRELERNPQALEFDDGDEPLQRDNSNEESQIMDLTSDEIKQLLSELKNNHALGDGANGLYPIDASKFEG